MNKQTLKSYVAMIKKINQSGSITEKEINRIKNGLNKNYDDVINLLEMNNFKYHYNIERIQEEKGKKYLIKKHLTLSGKKRKTSNIDNDTFIKAIKSLQTGEFYYFTFDGFKEVTNGFYRAFYPIYTLYTGDIEISYFHINGFDYEGDTTSIINGRGFHIYCYDL